MRARAHVCACVQELLHLALFEAERYVGDVCTACLPAAKRMPRASWEVPGTPGPSCSADYFTGAPRVEACNVTGDGWGGKPPCGAHCGRLKILCPVTKNDYEMVET